MRVLYWRGIFSNRLRWAWRNRLRLRVNEEARETGDEGEVDEDGDKVDRLGVETLLLLL